MKKYILKTVLGAATVMFIASSCSQGVAYPICATNNKSVKTGEAGATYFFGFGPMHPDLSIKTAAANGGITKVATVDVTYVTSMLGFKYTMKTVVTGE